MRVKAGQGGLLLPAVKQRRKRLRLSLEQDLDTELRQRQEFRTVRSIGTGSRTKLFKARPSVVVSAVRLAVDGADQRTLISIQLLARRLHLQQRRFNPPLRYSRKLPMSASLDF